MKHRRGWRARCAQAGGEKAKVGCGGGIEDSIGEGGEECPVKLKKCKMRKFKIPQRILH